ncbi:hypothetical protein D3C85_1083140 [compost metagenome]
MVGTKPVFVFGINIGCQILGFALIEQQIVGSSTNISDNAARIAIGNLNSFLLHIVVGIAESKIGIYPKLVVKEIGS